VKLNFAGADISDYFNYGFNEVTWKQYCDKQKRLRDGDTSIAPSLLGTPEVEHHFRSFYRNVSQMLTCPQTKFALRMNDSS